MAVRFVFAFAAILAWSSFVCGFPKLSSGYDDTGDIDNDFPLVPRDGWRGVPPTDTRPLATPAPYVVVHHTYIPGACNTTDSCSAAMRSMQNYHNSLGWGDIGYNFCVGSDGAAYEGRGWKVVGIHAGRANSVSIGICLIGDWREQLPPPQQLETTKRLIRAGVERGFILEQYKLIGHQQVMSTECPGVALLDEIKTWDHFTPISPEDPLVTIRKNRT